MNGSIIGKEINVRDTSYSFYIGRDREERVPIEMLKKCKVISEPFSSYGLPDPFGIDAHYILVETEAGAAVVWFEESYITPQLQSQPVTTINELFQDVSKLRQEMVYGLSKMRDSLQQEKDKRHESMGRLFEDHKKLQDSSNNAVRNLTTLYNDSIEHVNNLQARIESQGKVIQVLNEELQRVDHNNNATLLAHDKLAATVVGMEQELLAMRYDINNKQDMGAFFII